jgi:hypothetical protein
VVKLRVLDYLGSRQDGRGDFFVVIEPARHPLLLFLLSFDVRLSHERSAILRRGKGP